MRRTRSLSQAVPHRRRVHSNPAARGFTLVEMLVAVTLVLIMMSMFAEIFQIAGGSIAKTRGLAENDQRSRTLQTIIKADLDKRSFRWVYPFATGEDAAAPESSRYIRKGYFYISVNNPHNALDNVLQFTVESSNTSKNKDESPYYGQAIVLPGSTSDNKNQPDYDDRQFLNNTSSSTVAEVAYFVRNGNLYRRQLLVRESQSGTNPQPDDSPANTPPRNVFDPSASPAAAFQYSPGSSTFWADYDYSAYYNEAPVGTPTGTHFLGSDSLNNSSTISLNAIAAPFRRFGHYHRDGVLTSIYSGRPKEFSSGSAAADFIGRFTLQECSSPQFQYPQNRTAGRATSPTIPADIPTHPDNSLVLNADKIVSLPDDFSDGPRRGEDLLLSNVHAFDILVWDDNYGGFVSIGDPSLPATSDYYISSNLATTKRRNASYGPRLPATESLPTVVNAVFDTWHPFLDIDGAAGNDAPPFRPITYRPDYLTGPEPTPVNQPGQSEWQAATVYEIGDIVFPTATTAAAYPGTPFYYRCVQKDRGPKNKGKGKGKGLQGINRSDDTNEPSWPRAAGLIVEDNALSWQAVDNRKPLRAVKLEIRFIDSSTQQMRQMTLIHSLVD